MSSKIHASCRRGGDLSRRVAAIALAGIAVVAPVCGDVSLRAQDGTDRESPGRWEAVDSPVSVSLRGLCVVDPHVIWASGAAGTVLRSTDGGATFRQLDVPGAKDEDFRDVQAFGADVAVIMTAGQPARLRRTTDGGRTWEIVHVDPDRDAFFDAMAFWDDQRGIAMGDPLEDRLAIVLTDDGGRTWREPDESDRPSTTPGEHAYAASGSCVCVTGERTAWIGLGGAYSDSAGKARVLRTVDGGTKWTSSETPIDGTASAGIFSLAFVDESHGVAVGGDYLQPGLAQGNLALTTDGGRSWFVPPDHGLPGFRSSVVAVRPVQDGRPDAASIWIACGPLGCDWSGDGGRHWSPIAGPGFHALAVDRTGRHVWAVGSDGRIARWVPSSSDEDR